MRLVIGSRNRGKVNEIRDLVRDLGVEVVAIDEVLPDLAVPEETGSTFVENACGKALHYATRTGELCVADDSGLEVDALDGRPGIHSSSFGGVEGDDARNNARLVEELARRPGAPRTARYRCAIAVASPGRVHVTVEGACEGVILETPRGSGGFGYDPYFLPEGCEATFGEMDRDAKAALSHRGRALQELHPRLASLISILDNRKTF